ncbi:Aldehyde dehydrogenase, conserved site-containing protein [Artemisia annua]|uniref:Aldehyde dehydrogenase, conserved site-containing protein n=1 Tax=Artemisia annua TaxID=35608 RepID=A0A2U1L7T8_ARTAN|nr:Aldehyde dehydrogenase, conserved site-containing protein [Artemisia annua]
MASEQQVKKSTLFDTSSAETLVKDMRGAVSSGKTKSYEWRLGQLKSLLKMVESSEKLICDALFSDLGKPQHEAFIHEGRITRVKVMGVVCFWFWREWVSRGVIDWKRVKRCKTG